MKNVRLLFLFLIAFALVRSANATDYYLSNSGSDANSGTSSAQAWQTISKLNTQIGSMSAGDRIYFNRGDVFRGSINLNGKDGSSGNPITFDAYGTGARPIIRATKTVSSFSQSGNIWTKTDGSFTTSDYGNVMSDVLINGVAYRIGRHPNTGYYEFTSVTDNGSTWNLQDNTNTFSNSYWNGGIVKCRPVSWGWDAITINSYSSNTYTVYDSEWAPYHDPNTSHYLHYILINHENALDQNGEWAYNSSSQTLKLYYDGNLNSQTVDVPVYDYCLYSTGSNYITLKNLEFQSGNKYNIYFEGSGSNINVEDCTVRYAGIVGIQINSTASVVVRGDSIIDCKSTGIYCNASSTACYIDSCYIENIGKYVESGGHGDRTYTGIVSGSNTGDLHITDNIIQNVGYNGISFWSSFSGTVYVKRNFIDHFCMNLDDGGGIYSYKNNTSGVHKYIENNISLNGDGNYESDDWTANSVTGLYSDEDNKYFHWKNNVSGHNQQGIWFNGGSDNEVRSNLLVDIGRNTNPFQHMRCGLYLGNVWAVSINNMNIKNNVIVSSEADSSFSMTFDNIEQWSNQVDSNYYIHPFRSNDKRIIELDGWAFIDKHDISESQTRWGFDTHSSYGPSQKYADVSGITEDQYTKLLWNYSNSNRTVDLLDCTFKDIDGNTVSGSTTVSPYYGKVLFYTSGDSVDFIDEGNLGTPSAWDSTYTLTISTNGQGSVSPGSGSYSADTTLSLTATPSSGYEFTGWSGDTTATSNPLSVVMWKNKSITATFTDTTSTPPASDTIAFWRFENNADDETGVHDATLYGSPTYYTPAAEGSYALNLDGSGRYADCDTITLGNSFSISGHVLIWGSSGTRTIFSTTTTSALDGLVGYVNLSTGVFSLGTGDGSSSATATSTTGNHSSGSWVKFEYIVDCTANTCEIYIDDSDESSSTTIDGGFTDGKTFYIGQESSGYNDTRLWGRVDGLLIVGEGSGPVNPTVTISATDAIATEASETTGTYRFSRGSETSGNLTVNFSTSGTATLNTDYTLSASGSVTITNGNTYADITLTPDDDSSIEGSETAILTLSSGTGYTIGSPSSATVTITDDDFPVVTITATDATATEASETTGTYRISRGAETSGNLTVNLGTPTGTATFNTDYTLSSSGTVTITNGNTYADITLTPDDDASVEGSETAILSVTSGTGYTVGSPSSATITITDNDTSTESDTIAFWRFENNADDETGVHDATLYGSPTYYTPAAEGSYALNLDGSGRYADCDTITLGDSFSISGHVLIWGSSGTRTIFSTTTTSALDGLVGYVNLSTGVFSLGTGDGSSSATATSTTGNHSSGSWVKFEYIVDRTANTCEIYIDDSDESSSTTIDGDFTDGKTFYIGQETSGANDTRLWGRVDGLLIVGEGSTGGGDSPTIDTIGKINFTYSGYTETGWTNITGSTFNESLGDGVSISTDYSFSMGSSGEPSTVFPSNVGSTYNFMMNTNNSPAYITVSGLDTASTVTYRFSFFESRDDGSASGDRTTTYTIGSESVGTNPVGNTSTVLTIDSVAADASGEVEITVTKITDQYGYINAMIIEEVTEAGESRAILDPGQNLENILSKIEYYPVPVSDRLNLKNVPAHSLISVYDMVGHKVIEQRTGLGTDLQLNVSHLKSGIYLFRILDETSSVAKNFKIVKK